MHRFILVLLFALGLTACDAASPIDPGNGGGNGNGNGNGNPPAGNALDGIYMGLRENASGNVYEDFFTFYPDGRVLRSIPSEGRDRPYPGFPECQFDVCGTYTRSGGEVRVVWGASDTPDVYDLGSDGALQERGETGKHRSVAPTPAALDARYGVLGEDGEVWVSLRLHADGRFEEARLMDWTNWALDPVYPQREGQEVEGGRGTYTLRDNTLALRYEGGFTAYFSFVVPPGEAGRAIPETIYVTGGAIPRRP